MSIKHAFVSAHPDAADATKVSPSNWNANHVIDGNVDFAGYKIQNANVSEVVYANLSSLPVLGTAASTAAANYATAAQGALADTATQPEDLALVALSGAYADLIGKPTLGTAASTAASDYATAVHTHSAGDITSSTLALARIAGGTYNASTFLRGTSSFAQPSFSSLANMPTLGTAASTNYVDYAVSTHTHSASNITTSTFATARLGAGTASSNTFLRGDLVWETPTAATAWGNITGNVSTQADIYAEVTSRALIATLSSAAYTLSTIYASSTHNISSATHAFPGGTTFLRADGVFATPPGGASNVSTVKVTSERITTTTSTLALTELAFALTSASYYAFEFGILYKSRISSNGLRLRIDTPTFSTYSATIKIPTVLATGTDNEVTGWVSSRTTSVVSGTTPTASSVYLARIWGAIIPTANGTLQLMNATETAGQSISTCAGSYGRLTTL